MYIIKNISCRVSDQIDLRNLINRKFGITLEQITKVETLRRSIDARKRNDLRYNFTLLAEFKGNIPASPDINEYENPRPYMVPDVTLSNANPFIIGSGPAGLFAALALVEKGFQPHIYERGESVEARNKTVHQFWVSGKLDLESNVQFGEGGAGTFSDGKLTSRSSDFYTNYILNQLIQFGAPKNILFDSLPHIGTDGLMRVVIGLRTYLEEKGCKFFWKSKLEDMEITDGKISSVTINGTTYNPEIVVLAIGNAARDTFRMLNEKITLSAKPFALGFRIEHRQEYINAAFYGDKAPIKLTGPATYRLTAKHAGKGIFSFCNCPGGEIVGAASQLGGVVTNGMSNSSRSGDFANSAIVTTVNENDFGTEPLAGMLFQEKIEQAAYNEEVPFAAPSQAAIDYVKNKLTSKPIRTTYHPGGYPLNLNDIFPQQVNDALKTGLRHFEKIKPNFMKYGKLVGPETRTSSPIRMERDRETFLATGISNLYPLGEGSGFAGGIVSSAADGYKAMQKIQDNN